MEHKYVTLGDMKLRVVSVVTDNRGYIHIVAKPAISVCESESEVRMEISNTRTEDVKKAVITDKLVDVIQEFIDVRKTQFPNFSVVRNADAASAIMPISKLLKKGYSEEIIIECIRIGMYDDFWMRNLMTLTQLNKKCKSELTKFEHLLMIYEDKKRKKTSKSGGNQGTSYEEL